MQRFSLGTILLSLAACTAAADRAAALIVAADDASQVTYDDGWSAGDNGGSGFNSWSFVGRENGSGFGGGFIAGSGSSSIGSGLSNEAFGVYGNNGGVGAAVRPFSTPVLVGRVFSIDMDNQGIDTGGTVGFSLRNAAGNNLAEFYFVGGQSNYTVNGSGVSGTTPGYTTDGLKLSFVLTSANSFTLTMDSLANGVGVDNTATGNLLGNADQTITNLRLFNANGGQDVFFNNLTISAVPEASSIVFGCLVCSVIGLGHAYRKFRPQLPTAGGRSLLRVGGRSFKTKLRNVNV